MAGNSVWSIASVHRRRSCRRCGSARQPDVVDENIETAEGLNRARDDRVDPFGRRQIGDDWQD